MGGCFSNSESGAPSARSQSMGTDYPDTEADMDTTTAARSHHECEHPKWLLVGPSKSGKSTMYKQLSILWGTGFSDKALLSYKDTIYSSILEQIKSLVRQYERLQRGQAEFADSTLSPQAAECCERLKNLRGDVDIDTEIAEMIAAVWKEPAFRQIYANRHRFKGVSETTAPHFFDDIMRIARRHYIPTDKDVLFVQQETSHVEDTVFQIEEYATHIFDLGGSRSAQQGWQKYYQNVHTVIFVVSLSSYDEFLPNNLDLSSDDLLEDARHGRADTARTMDTLASSAMSDDYVNSLRYAMVLFGKVADQRWFEDSHVVVILNKQDVFMNKITKVPLTVCFPDYEGSDSSAQCIEFIEAKFGEVFNDRKHSGSGSLHTFMCNSLDRKAVEQLFTHLTMQLGV